MEDIYEIIDMKNITIELQIHENESKRIKISFDCDKSFLLSNNFHLIQRSIIYVKFYPQTNSKSKAVEYLDEIIVKKYKIKEEEDGLYYSLKLKNEKDIIMLINRQMFFNDSKYIIFSYNQLFNHCTLFLMDLPSSLSNVSVYIFN